MYGHNMAQLGHVGPAVLIGQRNYLWDLSGFPEEAGYICSKWAGDLGYSEFIISLGVQ